MSNTLTSLDSIVVGLAAVVVALQVIAFVITAALASRMRRLFLVEPIEIQPLEGSSDIVVDGGGLDVAEHTQVRFQIAEPVDVSAAARDLLERTNRITDIPHTIEGHIRGCTEIAAACAERYEGPVGILGSVPVYLGLAGTFAGVIYGLYRLSFGSGLNEESIPFFLSGVLIAMICSFAGVVLMVVSNAIILPNARIQRDRRMWDYLGAVEHALVDRIRETATASGTAPKRGLARTLDDFSYAMLQFTDALEPQRQLIADLRAINLEVIITLNTGLLDKAQSLMTRFVEFDKGVAAMTTALNESNKLVTTVTSLMNRISAFETSLNRFGDQVEINKTAMERTLDNVARTIEFISAQIKTLEAPRQAIAEFAGTAQFQVKDIILKYEEQMKNLADQSGQVLEDVGQRVFRSIENSAEPERVKALLQDVGTLPAILKMLEKTGEEERANRAELNASLPVILSELQNSAKRDAASQEELSKTMNGMVRSTEQLAKAVAALGRGNGPSRRQRSGGELLDVDRAPRRRIVLPANEPTTAADRGHHPGVGFGAGHVHPSDDVLDDADEGRAMGAAGLGVTVGVLLLSIGLSGYGLLWLAQTHLGAGLTFGGALLTYEAAYILVRAWWKSS